MATKTLSREQFHYAENRLTELYRLKEAAVAAECRIPGKGLTVREFIRLVKANEIKPYKHVGLDSPMVSNGSVFDTTKHITLPRPDQAKYAPRAAALRAEYTKMMDQLYLGDCAAALKAIQEFTTAKF